MFVVRRTFKDRLGIHTVGSVIEPTDIRRFKHFLAEGRIIEVTEHNYDDRKAFFKERFGVDLQELNTKPVTTVEVVPEPVIPEIVIPEPVIPEIVIPEPVIPAPVIPAPVIPVKPEVKPGVVKPNV